MEEGGKQVIEGKRRASINEKASDFPLSFLRFVFPPNFRLFLSLSLSAIHDKKKKKKNIRVYNRLIDYTFFGVEFESRFGQG